jgi:hypothetical protein
MSNGDRKAAGRRAVHLMLLARDNDEDGLKAEFTKLAFGDDADPEFVAAVLAVVLSVAGTAFRALEPDTLDRLIGHLSAQNAPDTPEDLVGDTPEAP